MHGAVVKDNGMVQYQQQIQSLTDMDNVYVGNACNSKNTLLV